MAANKKAGKKSLAQNDHLFPAAPLIGTATDVGTNRPFDDGAASVTFTAQGPNPATSFTITATAAGETTRTATGTSSPISVTGLKSNVQYSITVTSTNTAGASSPSSAVTVTATTVPAKPAAPTASSPNANQDVVNWLAPASGGKVITGYVWASNDGKTNATGGTPGGGATTLLSATISQEAGTAQTYTVYAINENGNSVVSDASNNITTTFSFAPFSAFGFSPFGAFGFSPFTAFSFWR